MPAFYAELFRCTPESPNVTPWEQSDMLRFFLDDAEDFFERGGEGSLSSGIWQEDGVERGTALSVSAGSLSGRQLLILRRLSDDYVDRARILQKAREHLLQQRTISLDLEMYKQKSRFDALTALHNRAAFMDALYKAITSPRTDEQSFALLILDIDDFKRINDTFGHLAGDTVLSALGRLLHAQLRREDLPARYGGEEFVVLAVLSGQAQAVRLAEKIRKSVTRHNFGGLPPITVSIGCSCLLPGDTPKELIQRADTALYDAKRAGKNCVRFR